MSSANDWATAIQVADKLLRGGARAVPQDEPTLLIQRIASNPILCGGPIEYFSKDIPPWCPKTPEEDKLLPIDDLYGYYDPKTRTIVIFVNRIDQDASIFGAEADELLEIVRIHEHAHAVVHLGSRADDIHKHLFSFDGSNKTAWLPFLDDRTSWFVGFPTDLHEFLAQALTYAAILELSAPQRREKLRRVFDSLEAKQPPHYQLSALVKQCAARADWPLVLYAARGAVDVYREQDFSLSAGLRALVCSVSESGAEGDVT